MQLQKHFCFVQTQMSRNKGPLPYLQLQPLPVFIMVNSCLNQLTAEVCIVRLHCQQLALCIQLCMSGTGQLSSTLHLRVQSHGRHMTHSCQNIARRCFSAAEKQDPSQCMLTGYLLKQEQQPLPGHACTGMTHAKAHSWSLQLSALSCYAQPAVKSIAFSAWN